MALDDEIQAARTEIAADGYDMSVGELVNLYRDREIIINPEFQRLFRWDSTRKTRFIESLLIGIPIPPIFVFQNEQGIWELIDGLQRISTILEFVGNLIGNGGLVPPSELEGTRFIPSLSGKRWRDSAPGSGDGIGTAQQLQIKRARIRVEILKPESDPLAKYELFQRLNTGGAELSEQEVRNCIALMVNREFYEWLKNCSEYPSFRVVIDQTGRALEQQSAPELALRFFVYRNVPYKPGLDVHEFLDEAMIEIAKDGAFQYENEKRVFEKTFSLLEDSLGADAFKRWNGEKFVGQFLLSVYEVVAIGVSKNLDAIQAMEADTRKKFLIERCRTLVANSVFQKNSGAGVRGTTRLSNLLPMAQEFFYPK